MLYCYFIIILKICQKTEYHPDTDTLITVQLSIGVAQITNATKVLYPGALSLHGKATGFKKFPHVGTGFFTHQGLHFLGPAAIFGAARAGFVVIPKFFIIH